MDKRHLLLKSDNLTPQKDPTNLLDGPTFNGSNSAPFLTGMAVISANGSMIHCNEELLSLVSFGEDLKPLPFPDCFGMLPDDELVFLEQARSKVSLKSLVEGELLPRKNEWHLKFRMLPNSGSDLATILIVEFPNKKVNDKDLYKSQLEARLNVLTHYTHIIAHDVRSPIQNLSILWRFLEEGKIKQSEFNTLTKKSLARLEFTLENLSWLLKQEHMNNLSFEKIEFEELFNSILDLYSAYIQDLNITITASFQVKEIRYNRPFLVSIISNLVNNAIKYRKHKRPLHIQVETHQTDQDILFSVKDNGIGFAPSETEKIFNKFTQSASRQEGSGLGLYICKKSLALLGDDITAEGKPGEGATFTLIFRKK